MSSLPKLPRALTEATDWLDVAPAPAVLVEVSGAVRFLNAQARVLFPDLLTSSGQDGRYEGQTPAAWRTAFRRAVAKGAATLSLRVQPTRQSLQLVAAVAPVEPYFLLWLTLTDDSAADTAPAIDVERTAPNDDEIAHAPTPERATWELDIGTGGLVLSPSGLRWLQFDAAAREQRTVSARRALRCLDADSRHRLLRALRDGRYTGAGWEIDVVVGAAGSEARWLRVIGAVSTAIGDGGRARAYRAWRGTAHDVSEVGRARHALQMRANEARKLALVASLTTNAVAITDADHRIEWVNDSFCRMTGYGGDEVIGRRPSELLNAAAPEAPAAGVGVRERLVGGLAISGLDLQMRRKDGQLYWAQIEVLPRWDDQGKVIGYIHLHTDITERMQALARSRGLLDRLQLVKRSANLALHEIDLDSGVTVWDPLTFELHGLVARADAPNVATMFTHVVADDRAALQQAHDAARRAIGTYDVSYRVCAPGTDVTRHLFTRLVSHGSAERPQRVLGVTMDLTAERASGERARLLETRLRLAVNAAGVGFWEIEPATDRVFWSDEMQRQHGAETAQTPRRLGDWLDLLEPADRTRLAALLRAAPIGPAHHLELTYRVTRADGDQRWIQSMWQSPDVGADGPIVGIALDVTARKRDELRLQEAWDLLERATGSSGVGIFEVNLDTGLTRWNRSQFDLYGLPAADTPPTPETVSALVVPEDRARACAAWNALIDGAAASECEFRVVGGDGSIRWLMRRASREARGTGARIVGLTVDLTQRKAAEQRAQKLTDLLRFASNAVGIGLWRRDLQSGEHFWDERTRALFGLAPDDPTPDHDGFLDAIVPADRAACAARFARLPASDQIEEVEYRIVRRNDGVERVLLTRRAIECDGVTPTHAYGAVLDVTEMRRTERERDELRQQVELITSAVGLGVWDYHPDRGWQLWNDEMYAQLGQTRAAFDRRRWLDTVHPDDRRRVRREIAIARRRRSSFDLQCRVIWPDGSVHWLASRGRVQQDGDGRRPRLFGVTWDVTDRRSVEAALQAKDDAERANLAKTHFVSQMSHELRTPLNAILGFAQILELDRREPLSAPQRERVGQIQRAGWHLLALIDEILELSQIEAGNARLNPAIVPLRSLLDECVDLIQAAARVRHLTIVVERGDETTPAHVRADRVRLAQVLLNLLSNAVKYNRHGGHIRIACGRVAPQLAYVDITDTGIGMSPAQLEQLFVPFNRLGVDGAGVEGSGIGLTIARRLVERMDGRLDVDSTIGEGTRFRVLLPEVAGYAAGATPIAADPRRVRDDVRGSILLVAADPAEMDDIKQLLALRPQLRLFSASDAASAFVLAAVCQPDLIAVSMPLRDPDAIGLIQSLRARPETAAIRAAAVGVDPQRDALAQLHTAGFAECWTRPLDPQAVLTYVDQTMHVVGSKTAHGPP